MANVAGEQAQALYAPQAAIVHFTQALDAARQLSLAPPVSLYRARGKAYDTLGEFERARTDLEAALQLAQVDGAKINADHRADLEINEQKQQILDRGAALLDHHHGVERRGGGPDGSAPNREQRKNVEAVGQQPTERIDKREHPRLRFLAGLFRSVIALSSRRALRTL